MTHDFYLIHDYSSERVAAQGTDNKEHWPHLTCFGLSGEAGEVVELVKKHLYHGKPLDPGKFHLELGDVLWYLNYGAHNHPNIHGLHSVANCSYFVDFDIGHVARQTDPLSLMGLATSHLIVDVGKIVAFLYFKEPWTAGPRELQQHMRGVLWAIAALAHVTGSDLETVARLNNDKLRNRYPPGFSVAAAKMLPSSKEEENP